MRKFNHILVLSGFLGMLSSQAQDAEPTTLETRTYQVAPGLVGNLAESLKPREGSSGSGYDPFQDPLPDFGEKPKKRQPIQVYLEESGIEFSEGATASLNPDTNQLTHTNTRKEIEKVEEILDQNRNDSEKQFFIYLEMIEVDHEDFSDWVFENVMTSDGTALRNEVQGWIREGDAEIIESTAVTARSGQRAKTQSVDEYIYPTEYDPPSVPNKVTLKDGAEAPVAAATPTAFQTRHLGITLEVDPVLGKDDVVNLNLAPENVQLDRIDQWHHRTEDPRFKANTPVFYTMKITTQVVGRNGRYIFLGSNRPLKPADPDRENPLVLQFVRADIGSTGDWKDITDLEAE